MKIPLIQLLVGDSLSDCLKTPPYTFGLLEWDSVFFGIPCAKASLLRTLSSKQWEDLKSNFRKCDFICIQNNDSNPENSVKIGQETSSFLADVNIQFKKKLTADPQISSWRNITISESLKYDDELIEIMNFKYSRFIDDEILRQRGGKEVYSNWLKNAFDKSGKYFAVHRDENNFVTGYLLFSFFEKNCTVELLNVKQGESGKGVGRHLIKTAESFAWERGMEEISVGTQIRNISAINFYNLTGFRQSGCHQIYHLWNKTPLKDMNE